MTIVKTAKTAVEITAFHRDVLAIARTGHNAAETMARKMQALLVSKYGQPVISKGDDGAETRSGGPSFEQYRADRAALKQLAADKGLADDQWLRKPFCAAVVALYGKLPESQSPEALRKAQERKVAQEAVAALRKAQGTAAAPAAPAAPVGAPKGETQDRAPSETEQLESLITRIGLFKTLDACIRILAADESTQAQAAHLAKMAQKAAEVKGAALTAK